MRVACHQVVSGQRVTRVVLSGWTYQGGLRVVSQQGGLIKAACHQGGLIRVVLPEWSHLGGLIRVVSPRQPVIRVVAHQGGLIRAACQSLIRVVSHQGAPSVGSSLISLSSLENKVFEFEFS